MSWPFWSLLGSRLGFRLLLGGIHHDGVPALVRLHESLPSMEATCMGLTTFFQYPVLDFVVFCTPCFYGTIEMRWSLFHGRSMRRSANTCALPSILGSAFEKVVVWGRAKRETAAERALLRHVLSLCDIERI